ncbi:MAG TPA: DMT family transporter [Anaerolineales bacterium]
MASQTPLTHKNNPPAKLTGGHWFVLAAAVLWGTTGTAQALAPPGAQPVVIGALRLAVGGSALLILATLRGSLNRGQNWFNVPTGLASLSMAAYQLLFFAGVARTGVAVGTIVAIGSAPVLAGILAYLTGRERLERSWFRATLVAIIGCAFIILPGGNTSIDPAGFTLTLGAGLAYATYALASKALVEQHAPDAVVAVVFSAGAILLSPILFRADLGWLAAPGGLGVALHLGLLATAAAYILFSRGLQAIPVATAVTYSLAEPLTAAALGVLLLGEDLTVAMLVGMGMVFAGLAILAGTRDKG